MFSLKTINRAWMALLLVPVLFSCSTYRQKMSGYYTQVQKGNYDKANTVLEENSYIHADRNKLLLSFEKGKLFHLQKKYDSSNYYFNIADELIEQASKNVGDVAVGLALNPMLQQYKPEDFESVMIHYYKALNYVYVNKLEDAVVEARRITLANNRLQNNHSVTTNKYNRDAFLENFEGILYELSGDINNAFISYRNAADIYLKNKGVYYDVSLPKQLQKDVIRTALQLGFGDIAQNYQSSFQLIDTTENTISSENGELIIFLENGWAPFKEEQALTISKDGYGNTDFFYYDASGNSVRVPFDYGYYRTMHGNNFDAKNISITRIAMPYYTLSSINKPFWQLSVNGTSYTTELAQNFNSLAINTLQERMLKEVANAIARQIVKKLVEKGVELGAKEIAKNSSKEKDEQKKKENAEAIGMAAGLLVNLINMSSEKADTRNWQSLPAFIYYVRVPLQKGENIIQINFGSTQQKFVIQSKKGIQLLNTLVNN